MSRKLVYDLPTRLFHWLFAGLFIFSFFIAKTIDDGSFWFNYHSLSGLILGFLVLLRIIWGIFGTQHAKFKNFKLNPKDLFKYFGTFLNGRKIRWAGHNPASSWAAIIMMFFALGLSVTGYLMSSGPNKEDFEDIHEIFANGLIITVVLHVAGVILHSFRHQEMIGLSMLDGKKENIKESEKIFSTRIPVALIMIGLLIAFTANLINSYDRRTGTVQFFGTILNLGESEDIPKANDED